FTDRGLRGRRADFLVRVRYVRHGDAARPHALEPGDVRRRSHLPGVMRETATASVQHQQREDDIMDHRENQPLRIVIVGGVAGGASAATRARRVNEEAQIILFEKDAHVSFANCGLPYYIGGEISRREKLLVATPELFRERFNIDVRTRQEVLAIDRKRRVVQVVNHATGERYEQPYDRLILAPGASPIVPPMAGVDGPNVFTLRNLADTDEIVGWI